MKNFLSSTKGKIIAGAVTLLLIAGVVVLIILLNTGYRLIRVKDLNGTSKVTSGLSVSDAFKGQNLVSGDNVEVFENSYLMLALDSDKHVVASELTKFSVEAFGVAGKDSRTIIHLEKGSISNEIDTKLLPSESYVVESPNASMSVRGTVFSVNVFFDNEGLCHTTVEVKDGVVELAEKDTGIVKTLNAGQRANVVSRSNREPDRIPTTSSDIKPIGDNSGDLEQTLTFGDFEYRYLQRLGGMEITKYIGTDTVVAIPAEIEGKPVVSVNGFSKTKVTSVTIPDGVKEIGIEAFSWCTELTTVEVPDSVTRICNCAFFQCKKLQSVRIPDGVTTIETAAFSNCEKLTSINIPNGVTEIKQNAFSGCYALKSIEIPDSVTSIGLNAFASCFGLKSITIPGSVTRIEQFAFQNNRITSLTIENGVKEIGEGAFQSCAEIMSIEIPDSVTKIEQYAFRGCKATITYKGKTYLYTDNMYEGLYTE